MLVGVLHRVAIFYRSIDSIDVTNVPVSVETAFFIVAHHVEKEEAMGENDATGRLLVVVTVTVTVDRRRLVEVQTKNLAFCSNASPGTNDQ